MTVRKLGKAERQMLEYIRQKGGWSREHPFRLYNDRHLTENVCRRLCTLGILEGKPDPLVWGSPPTYRVKPCETGNRETED